MLPKTFWTAAGERALKTFCQSLIAALVTSSGAIDILHTNWVGALSISAGATLLSLLTSFGSIGVDAPGSLTSFRLGRSKHEAP